MEHQSPVPTGSLPCTCGVGFFDPGSYDSSGLTTCGSCGRQAYSGYVAEAVSLEPQVAFIKARLDWLTDRVNAGDAMPSPETAQAYSVWAPPSYPGANQAHSYSASLIQVPPKEPASLQTTLLVLGGILLAVAAFVFSAIMWDNLGPWGQVTILVAAAAGFGFAGTKMAGRDRLHATGNTFIVVSYLVSACILFVAAPAVGLVSSNLMRFDSAYPALASTLLAVAAIYLGRATKTGTWMWLGWLTVPFSVGLWIADVVLSLPEPHVRFWPTVSLAVVLMGVFFWKRYAGSQTVAPDASRFGLTLVFAVSAVSVVSLTNREAWWTWLSIFAASVVVALVFFAKHPRSNKARLTVALAVPVFVGWAMSPLSLTPNSALTMSLLVGALGAVLVFETRYNLLPDADAEANSTFHKFDELGPLSGIVLWTVWFAGYSLRAEDGNWNNIDVSQVYISLAAIISATCFLYAILRKTPILAWAAVIPGALSFFIYLTVYSPGRVCSMSRDEWTGEQISSCSPYQLEVYTVPLTILLGLAGLIWFLGSRTAKKEDATTKVTSRTTVLPALAVMMIPSAVLTWDAVSNDNGLTSAAPLRFAITTILAVLMLIAGTQWKNAAFTIVGLVSLVIVALGQIVIYGSHLPGWALFAAIGAILVAAGARVEWLRGQGRTWASRFQQLG